MSKEITAQIVKNEITVVVEGGLRTTDHGQLNGLPDDDHPQYLNQTRGDDRYYTKTAADTIHSNLQDLATSEFLIIPVGDETSDLTIGAGKVRFKLPFSISLIDIQLFVNSAPLDGNIVVDIKHENSNVSVFTNKPRIDDGTRFSTESTSQYILDQGTAVFDNSSVMVIDIDSVGSFEPGKGLKINLLFKRI